MPTVYPGRPLVPLTALGGQAPVDDSGFGSAKSPDKPACGQGSPIRRHVETGQNLALGGWSHFISFALAWR